MVVFCVPLRSEWLERVDDLCGSSIGSWDDLRSVPQGSTHRSDQRVDVGVVVVYRK